MHHIEGGDRNQAQLLPAPVDDYVDRDNPVRLSTLSWMIWTSMRRSK
jgi:hypothetical protein